MILLKLKKNVGVVILGCLLAVARALLALVLENTQTQRAHMRVHKRLARGECECSFVFRSTAQQSQGHRYAC
jgi:hypothetical protein